jgi:5-methylcytosine-specific restriction endonuclease McrA
MSEPIDLHKRKPLTALQRAKLYDAHDGKCWICGLPIAVGDKWRDEHKRPLALGGTNAMDNRAPVHIACAREKDAQDIPAIAKAKRTRAKHVGAKRGPVKRIASRGFSKAADQGKEARIRAKHLAFLEKRRIVP